MIMNFPCVSGVVLDYMHVICLGVVKRLLTYLKKGPHGKISARHFQQVSDSLTRFALPSAFARQPRSMWFLDRWKATELRHFMLYTGPLALKDVVDSATYKHFMSLLNKNDEKRNQLLQYYKKCRSKVKNVTICWSWSCSGQYFIRKFSKAQKKPHKFMCCSPEPSQKVEYVKT